MSNFHTNCQILVKFLIRKCYFKQNAFISTRLELTFHKKKQLKLIKNDLHINILWINILIHILLCINEVEVKFLI